MLEVGKQQGAFWEESGGAFWEHSHVANFLKYANEVTIFIILKNKIPEH